VFEKFTLLRKMGACSRRPFEYDWCCIFVPSGVKKGPSVTYSMKVLHFLAFAGPFIGIGEKERVFPF
jgi:hypothetical protein